MSPTTQMQPLIHSFTPIDAYIVTTVAAQQSTPRLRTRCRILVRALSPLSQITMRDFETIRNGPHISRTVTLFFA